MKLLSRLQKHSWLIVTLLISLIIGICVFLSSRVHESFTSVKSTTQNDIMCIYVAYEKNDEYIKNIKFFLNHGILPSVDYIFVLNGNSTIKYPTAPNITIMHRENKGYDFGAWGDALRSTRRQYRHYIFVNTSIRGPYNERVGSDWTKPFIDLIQGDVKLVGLTINILTRAFGGLSPSKVHPHVQSMVFVTDRNGKDLLVDRGIFDPVPEHYTFTDLIVNREVGMSTAILQNGWNISCLAKKYQDQDYRTIQNNINNSSESYGGDPFFPGAYFGETLDKYDILFYKTERLPQLNEE